MAGFRTGSKKPWSELTEVISILEVEFPGFGAHVDLLKNHGWCCGRSQSREKTSSIVRAGRRMSGGHDIFG